MAKTFCLDITYKLFCQIGTIDVYHFTLLSLTLTLPGGLKVSTKQSQLASFSCTLFNWSGWILSGFEAFQVEHPDTILSEICWRKGNNCCLYILILVWSTLTVVQGHRNARKQKLVCQLSHKVFSHCEWNLLYCWGLLLWWAWYWFAAFIQYSRERTLLMCFDKKKKQHTHIHTCLYIGLYSDIYRPISFKLVMIIETSNLYILISWMTLTFLQGHSCIRNKNFGVHFFFFFFPT